MESFIYSYNRKWEKKAINIEDYPKAKEYLLQHYDQLSNRKYVIQANRNWYEIWVPQNPESWKHRKIVFRDISEHPQFWLDTSGAIVNGDCYWIEIQDCVMDDVVYLALAIANSRFIENIMMLNLILNFIQGKEDLCHNMLSNFRFLLTPLSWLKKQFGL